MGRVIEAYRRHKVLNDEDTDAKDRYEVVVKRGGKPIFTDRPESIINVDEKVMEWRNASHVHAWFLANVMDGTYHKDRHRITNEKLRLLLSVCEKVLAASHLVPEKRFADTYYFNSSDCDAARKNGKMIKNMSVAHRLLPVTNLDHGGYDEAYLKAVDDTRAWVLRMLADSADGEHGDILISSSRSW